MTYGAPLSGTLVVETRCGTVSASLAAGYYLSGSRHDPFLEVEKYNYLPVEGGEIARVPLYQLDDLVSVTLDVPGAGFPRSWAEDVRFGCRSSSGPQCAEDSPYPIVGGGLYSEMEVEGRAQWMQLPSWPESVVCGTETELPVLATKLGGVEGYVELGRGLMRAKYSGNGGLTVAGESVPSSSVLNEHAGQIWYPDARDGGIVYRALDCDRMREPYFAQVSVRGPGTNGYYEGQSLRVDPPPPVRLRLSPTRDTLDASVRWARVPVTAILEDSTEAYVDLDEPITYGMSGPLGALRTFPDAADGSLVLTPTATLPYERSSDGRHRAHIEGVTVLVSEAEVDSLQYDAVLRVTASGAGVSGDTTLVVRGREGAGPDSLSVTFDASTLDCGDSTRVFAEGLLDGDPREIPPDTPTMLWVTDATHTTLAWGDSTAASLTVPFGVVRDGLISVQTRNCDGIDGEISPGVGIRLEGAYWRPRGTLSGEATLTVRGAGAGGDLVVALGKSVLGPGQSTSVSVTSGNGAELDPDEGIDLSLDPAAAAAGVLTWNGLEGETLYDVPLRAFEEGNVLYTVGSVIRPPTTAAATADDPDVQPASNDDPAPDTSESSTERQDAPSPSSPVREMPAVDVTLTASLTRTPDVAETISFGIVPYGLEMSVSPDVIRAGELSVVTVAVVETGANPLLFVVPEAWSFFFSQTNEVFVCAQDIPTSEDADADAIEAVFNPIGLTYGRSTAAPYNCAALLNQTQSPLGQEHDVTLTYFGPYSGADRIQAIYAGLAVREDGLWIWGSGPLADSSDTKLLESRSLRVVPTTAPKIELTMEVSETEVWPTIPSSGACTSVSTSCRGTLPTRKEGTKTIVDVDNLVDDIVVRFTENDAPLANTSVQVSVDWVEGSGGHSHEGGTRLLPASKRGHLRVEGSDANRGVSVTVTTDASGVARLSYVAPEYGGQVVLRVAGTRRDRAFADSATVEIRVPGLEPLPGNSSLYYEIGGTLNHHGPKDVPLPAQFIGDADDNHYAHPEVNAAMASIARVWLEASEEHTPISINDMSLPNGGGFHIGGNWSGSHKFHRVGQDVDIRTRRWEEEGAVRLIKNRQGRHRNEDFEDTTLLYGGVADIHFNVEHYHIYFYTF